MLCVISDHFFEPTPLTYRVTIKIRCVSLLAGDPEESTVANFETKVQKKHLHGNLGGTEGMASMVIPYSAVRLCVKHGLTVCFYIYKRVQGFLVI